MQQIPLALPWEASSSLHCSYQELFFSQEALPAPVHRDRDPWQGRNMSAQAGKGLDTHFPIKGSTASSLHPEMQTHSHVAPLNPRLPRACPVPRRCCALRGVSKDSDMQIHRQACACCNTEEAARWGLGSSLEQRQGTGS